MAIQSVTTPKEYLEAGHKLMLEKTNPYQSPRPEMIDKTQIDPLWVRLYYALWPAAKCVERGHDWDYPDDFSFKRVCHNCGKFEQVRT